MPGKGPQEVTAALGRQFDELRSFRRSLRGPFGPQDPLQGLSDQCGGGGTVGSYQNGRGLASRIPSPTKPS